MAAVSNNVVSIFSSVNFKNTVIRHDKKLDFTSSKT